MKALTNRWPFLAGFLLSVNVYLIPTSAASPRGTDLAGALLGLWILSLLIKGRLSPRHLALTALAMLPPGIWALVGILDGDPATVVQGSRWVLAGPWALALLRILDHDEAQIGFAWGLCAGAMVNVGVILLQVAGMESLLIKVGLSSAGAAFNNYVAYIVRFPGLHGHHNASSAVISLVVPAGMFLFLRGRCSLLGYLALLGGLVVALNLTSTRSPLLVTIITLAMAAITARKPGKIIPGIALFLLIVIPGLLMYGPPGGWSRWRNVQAVVSNAQERMETNLGAMDLSLAHPFGLGVAQGKSELGDLTALAASHNAFLEAALVFGLPFGFLVLLGMMRGIMGIGEGSRGLRYFPGLLALHTAGLFMFEEHLNNPTFIIITFWFIAAMAWRPSIRVENPLPVE